MVEIEKINYNRVRMHDTMKLIKYSRKRSGCHGIDSNGNDAA